MCEGTWRGSLKNAVKEFFGGERVRAVAAHPKGILRLGCCWPLQVGSAQSRGGSAKKATSALYPANEILAFMF